jgi:hypothetical protein
MTWTGAALPITVALAVVLLPGLAIAAAARLRGITALALAGPLGFAVIGVAGVASSLVHVRFGWWSVAATALLAVLVVVALRALLTARGHALPAWDTWRPASWLPVLVSAAVASTAIALVAFDAVPSPERISQTYDAVFHLNAVASILQSGDASSLHLYRLTNPGKSLAFYPAVWHSITALTAQLTGASVPVAANATWIGVTGPVFSLGSAFAAAVLLGGTGLRRQDAPPLQRTLIASVAALLASTFVAFPYLLLDFGTLYPNGLAYTTLPVGLALIAAVVRFPPAAAWRPESPDSRVRTALLLVAWFGSAAFTHPRSVVAILVLGVPLLVAWFAARMSALGASGERGRRRARIGWGLLVLAAVLLVVIGSVGVYHYYDVATRPISDHLNGGPARARESFGTALLQGLLATSLISPGQTALPPAVVLAGFALAGLVAALLRPGLRWMVVTYLAIVLLYGFAAGSDSDLAKIATGLWDKDKFRILAMLPVIGVPLVAWTVCSLVTELVTTLRGRTARRQDARPATVVVAVGVVSVLIAALTWTGPALGGVSTAIGTVFDLSDSAKKGDVVDADQVALLKDVGRFVPAGQVIADNPWNGSALAWAYGGRQTLFPHLGGYWGDQRKLVGRHLDDWSTDPAVCTAVRHLDLHWVLTDTGRLRGGGRAWKAFAGVDKVVKTPGVRLVANSGSARLYRLTACWS